MSGIDRGERIMTISSWLVYRIIPSTFSRSHLICYRSRMQAVVCFEIRYSPPDGSCSSYAASELTEDEQQMLIDIEQNIANLERSLEQANSSNSGKRRGSWHTPEKSSKKVFLSRGMSVSTNDKSPDTRKRWVINRWIVLYRHEMAFASLDAL